MRVRADAFILLAGLLSLSCEGQGVTPLALEVQGLDLEAEVTPAPPAAPVITRVEARFVPPLPAQVAEGAGIVQSQEWALALGKALFWDQQAGSDGQACASCHFQAGADPRLQGQLNPGFLDVSRSGGDTSFGSLRSDTGGVAAGHLPGGAEAGAGTTLVAADFPLHRLLDEGDHDSPLVSETNDAISSAGAFAATFAGIDADGGEHCGPPDASVFQLTAEDGTLLAARQVEPRNTPTTINAVFNMRQFWDGRANNLFNGVGVFGQRDLEGDPNARLIELDETGNVRLGALSLENASLASQAVGPPTSPVEMSCAGRSFADIGRKLLRLAPLARQRVDPRDSVLGSLASPEGNGLLPGYSYAELIQQAFAPRYWAASGRYRRVAGALVQDDAGYTQISDRSEFDSLVASGDITVPNCNASANVDPLLARGCKIFFRFPFGVPADGIRGAGCSACHAGTDTFSEGAVQAGGNFRPLLQVTDINNVVSTRDLGFSNIGPRPLRFDRALGGDDPYGNPLAFGRQYREFVATGDRSVVKDPLLLRAIDANALVAGRVNPGAKLESDGATKIPGIRNVALTPPYFSYGGYANLRQVMKFYNRGGNRRSINAANAALEGPGSGCSSGDDTGTGADGNHPLPVSDTDCNTNVTGLMVPLGLLDCDENGAAACDVATDDLSALVRFLQSLTDRRVQCDQAPFDHPSLSVPHGHEAREGDIPGAALDRSFTLPAVGVTGYDVASGLCIPNSGDLFAAGMQGRVGGVQVPLVP